MNCFYLYNNGAFLRLPRACCLFSYTKIPNYRKIRFLLKMILDKIYLYHVRNDDFMPPSQ